MGSFHRSTDIWSRWAPASTKKLLSRKPHMVSLTCAAPEAFVCVTPLSRCRCPCGTFNRNSVRHYAPVVFPLPCCSWLCDVERIFDICHFPSSVPRRLVKFVSCLGHSTNCFLPDCRAEIGLIRAEDRDASQHSPFRQILTLKSVHILAAFVFLYVGTEVSA